jgi:hypothetical protein
MLGDGLAELGHLLESRLILPPGILEKLRVDLTKIGCHACEMPPAIAANVVPYTH